MIHYKYFGDLFVEISSLSNKEKEDVYALSRLLKRIQGRETDVLLTILLSGSFTLLAGCFIAIGRGVANLSELLPIFFTSLVISLIVGSILALFARMYDTKKNGEEKQKVIEIVSRTPACAQMLNAVLVENKKLRDVFSMGAFILSTEAELPPTHD